VGVGGTDETDFVQPAAPIFSATDWAAMDSGPSDVTSLVLRWGIARDVEDLAPSNASVRYLVSLLFQPGESLACWPDKCRDASLASRR